MEDTLLEDSRDLRSSLHAKLCSDLTFLTLLSITELGCYEEAGLHK